MAERLTQVAPRGGVGLEELSGIIWPGARKPFDMLVPIATKIGDALSAEKRKISLNTCAHRASTELTKFLSVLLAVENGLFQCTFIPSLRNGW